METKTDPNAIRRLRLEASRTQVDIAKALGVDTNTVSRWERGAGTPRLRQQRRLAGLFKVAVEDLGLPSVEPPAKPLAYLQEPKAVAVDPRVTRSQAEWRATRQALNAHRNDLAQVAAAIYPDSQIDHTGAIATPGWIPDAPVPLDDIRLEYRRDAPSPKIDGAEAESRSVRPLASLTRPFGRYTHAIRDIDAPRLFENRASWRLLDVDWSAPRMVFGDCTFFQSVDVNESASHELALMTLDDHGHPSGRQPHMRDLPFRRLIGDPFALDRRPVIPAISTLTLRGGPEPSFLLHRRDSGAVAMAGGVCQLVPSGVFQPSSVMPVIKAGDFSLWRNFQREFCEELLGMDEFDGDGQPVDYTVEPFAGLDRAKGSGRLRMWCLGVALDGLTLFGEILTVAVLDPDLFDAYAGDFVESNPEGTIVDQRVPFTEAAIGQLLDSGRMAPAGGACLTLAWQHRGVLLG